VGPKYVSDEDVVLESYSRDTSPLPPNKQGIVVRPSCTDEVVDIVKLANTTKIPIVPSGGRASFYGTPKGLHGKGIVVDMTRMNKLLKVDEMNLTATAESGMTTCELTTRLWDMGWNVHTAVQPWYPDTLGGQISGFCGAGAGMELPYASHNALHIAGVKVVLPNGEVVQTGSGAGVNIMDTHIGVYDRYPGTPDLTGIFMGDGGTFGIKVEATYRMHKMTKIRKPIVYYAETFEKAIDCALEITTIEPAPYFNIAVIPSLPMWVAMGMEPLPMVIVMAKGNTDNEVNAKLEILKEVFERREFKLATGPGVDAWIQDVLTGRRFQEMGLFGSQGVWAFFEYYVARSQVVECYHNTTNYIYGRLKEKGVDFHPHEGIVPTGPASWIVSNVVWTKGEDPYARQVMQELFADATEYACSKGYFPDCHQGWGTRMMAKYWPKHHYTFMKTLKGALDPNNIMNPGVWDL